jgi:hypothetical protein
MLKKLMLVASLAVIASALLASPAWAVTKWSSTGSPGSATMKGTLTLKKGGGSAVSCSVSVTSGTENRAEGAFFASFLGSYTTKCANGLNWVWNAEGYAGAKVGEGFPMRYFTGPSWGEAEAPWTGTTWVGSNEGAPPFVNGSGGTQSYINFNETKLGLTNGLQWITATGKLTVEKNGGGLLTIS